MIANRIPKRHLCQFFTPRAIVEFMLDLVGFDPGWKVLDPSCGEGAFLKEALRRGATLVAGVDVDDAAITVAREDLHQYASHLKFFHQDGLSDIVCPDPTWEEGYDLVIGNPPFAAGKRRIRDADLLRRFKLAQLDEGNPMATLSSETTPQRTVRTRPSQVVEILFLERFIQLARAGGKVAIILPEGILANTNLRYVREWLVENFTIRAIIGLPRDTFKDAGTRAKTDILYLEKRQPPQGHRVLLADLTQIHSNGTESSELQQVLATLNP